MTDSVSNLSRLRIWCVLGLLLSVYATYVELRAERDASYVALCDVSAQISCTAVFTTVYGRGFGILQQLLGTDCPWIPPNGAIGFLFYGILFTTTYSKRAWVNYLRLILSVFSNLLSFYLAYLLYFVLKNLCFICIAIYIVNFNCLIQIWRLHKIAQLKKKLNMEAVTESRGEKSSSKKSE